MVIAKAVMEGGLWNAQVQGCLSLISFVVTQFLDNELSLHFFEHGKGVDWMGRGRGVLLAQK